MMPTLWALEEQDYLGRWYFSTFFWAPTIQSALERMEPEVWERIRPATMSETEQQLDLEENLGDQA
jgi:hypothetical protein